MSTLLETAPFIVQATVEDFGEIAAIMLKANLRAAASRDGQLQWPNTAFVHAQIAHHLHVGEYHVAKDESQKILGGVAVTTMDGMWPEQQTGERALYFHKLMKDPEVTRARVTPALFRFIAEAAQEQGISMVRCDVQSSMPRLIDYYMNLGFSPEGNGWYESLQKPSTLLQISAAQLLAKVDPSSFAKHT